MGHHRSRVLPIKTTNDQQAQGLRSRDTPSARRRRVLVADADGATDAPAVSETRRTREGSANIIRTAYGLELPRSGFASTPMPQALTTCRGHQNERRLGPQSTPSVDFGHGHT